MRQLNRIPGIYVYALGVVSIVVLSFRLFSTMFYPLVNADEGIIVLMLHYFSLPDDLYFWGQDRYGALIPLLGQVPFRWFGLSSLVSESIIHYGLLVAGFLALAGFIENKYYRLIFAVAWFFPPLYQTDLLRNVFGLQYSLAGISLWLVMKLENTADSKSSLLVKLGCGALLLLVMTTALWVSDLTLTTILAFCLVSGWHLIKEKKPGGFFRSGWLYATVIFILFAGWVIFRLKSMTVPVAVDNYRETGLNGPEAVIQALRMLAVSLGRILFFQIPELLFSLYTWTVIMMAILMLFSWKKFVKGRKEQARMILIFMADILVLTGVVLISEWALVNEMPRRYFTGVHISFWMAVLMLMSRLYSGRLKNALIVLAVASVLLGAAGTVYHVGGSGLKSFRPKADLAKEFNTLGRVGIIADYWNAYGNAFADPDRIKATPHEFSYAVRNAAMVDSVFAQPRLLLVRDMWMDEFPEELTQFDRELVRKGEPFSIAGCSVCEYEIRKEWMLGVHDLKHAPGRVIKDEATGLDVLEILDDCAECKYTHVIFGPFMTLLEGRYEVTFRIKTGPVPGKPGDIAELDVVTDYGNQKHAVLKLSSSNGSPGTEFRDYRLAFELPRKEKTVEFRIYYLGNTRLVFESLRLSRVP